MSQIVVCSIGLCLKDVTSTDEFSKLLKQNNVIIKEPQEIGEDLINEKLTSLINADRLRRIDRASKILLVATLLCNKDLNIDLKKYMDDIGIIVNTSFGAINSLTKFLQTALTKGSKNASPIIFPYTVPNAPTGVITINLELRGFNTTISGFNPVGYAYDLLKLERAKGFFTGGFDELSDMLKLTDIQDNVVFSNGIGEGSSMLFLTTNEFAEANNLNRLFEIFGFSSNYNTNTEFSLDNSNSINEELIENCIMRVITENQIISGLIDIIISPFNKDSNEAFVEKKVVNKIFPDNIPEMQYPKSNIGEVFGCNSTVNVIAGHCYLNNNKALKYCLVNSYDIGGNYSSIIIKNT